MLNMPDYKQINNALRQENIGITAGELHGLITGILAGGNHDESWKALTYDMVNDGNPFTETLARLTEQLYQETKVQLIEDNFDFKIFIDDTELFAQIDDLVNWINHFLLGIALVQPKLAKIKGDVAEALSDLREMTKLTYNEDDDPEELAFAFEEILEYVRVAVMLCHTEFSQNISSMTIH